MAEVGNHPNRGRKPYPTLEQVMADPGLRKRVLRIQREFAASK